jgi:hypothetical protein
MEKASPQQEGLSLSTSGRSVPSISPLAERYWFDCFRPDVEMPGATMRAELYTGSLITSGMVRSASASVRIRAIVLVALVAIVVVVLVLWTMAGRAIEGNPQVSLVPLVPPVGVQNPSPMVTAGRAD